MVEQKKKSAQDYECPVCMYICAEPVLTPCKHMFCLSCQKAIVSMGMVCPMCRAHFDKLFVPLIDKEMQKKIQEDVTELFEERKQELIKDGKWMGNKRQYRLAFGNTHELVEDPKPSISKPKTKNIHRWAMFITLNNESVDETSKFIKSVTYHLHPTFTPNKIKVEQAPFLLSRVGWGYFEITMDVEFTKVTGLGTRTLTHELCFENKGKTQSFMIDVDIDSEPGQNDEVKIASKSLASEFEKL